MSQNFDYKAKIALARAHFFEQTGSVESETSQIAPDVYYLTLPAQLAIAATGADVPVDPHFVALWRRSSDTDFECPRNFDECFTDQLPLRQAWLETLAEPQPDTFVQTGDWQERILRLIASERVMTRALLAQKLHTSLATISRELAELLADDLVDEESQSERTGRPQQILRLSAAGLEKAHADGIDAIQAPSSDSKALGERLFHQAIELAVRKSLPEAVISRTYANLQGKSLPSPLGTIIPDLIITDGWNRWVIEAETGKYNYRRLAEKLDKYLSSSEQELLVIAENSSAATPAHIGQWLRERVANLPAGCPEKASLRIKYTIFDRLQQHGLLSNIWQVFELGSPTQIEQPDAKAAGQDSIKNIMYLWRGDGQYMKEVFIQRPACIPDAPEIPMPELAADGVFVQRMFAAEPGANVICFLNGSDWDAEEIEQFLDQFSSFVSEYVRQFEVHDVGHAIQFRSEPWLYGLIVLVHDVPGQDNPRDMARAFANWRAGVQAWETEHHPLRVGVAHLDQIKFTSDPYALMEEIYDLAGYC